MDNANVGPFQIDPCKGLKGLAIKVFCASCKRYISLQTRIVVAQKEYCVSCFAKLPSWPITYQVLNKLSFPLVEDTWSAREEMLMLEAMGKFGFGNWEEISEEMGCTKTKNQVERHYIKYFLNTTDRLPVFSSFNDGQVKPSPPEPLALEPPNNRRAQSSSSKIPHGKLPKLSGFTEKTCYIPRRRDFELEYDNEAELILAQAEFDEKDSQNQVTQMQRLIQIYNHRLKGRNERKDFVVIRKLLQFREQVKAEKPKNREERELLNVMRALARFSTPVQHERLVNLILRERMIRLKLEEIGQFGRKVSRNLGELEQEYARRRENKERNFKQFRATESQRQIRANRQAEQNERKQHILSIEEEEFCQNSNLIFQHFSSIKDVIIKDSLTFGFVRKKDIVGHFEPIFPAEIVEQVFQFLAQRQDLLVGIEKEVRIHDNIDELLAGRQQNSAEDNDTDRLL